MLDVEDWAEIRRLRRSEGMSISQIARVVGLARNTVKAALVKQSPPRYRREPAGSLADEFEPAGSLADEFEPAGRLPMSLSRGYGNCFRRIPRCRRR